MEEVKYITVGNFDFIIIEEIDVNNNHYMIAIDEDGEDTIAVLKQMIDNGEETAIPVEDDDELEMVLELIKKEENN